MSLVPLDCVTIVGLTDNRGFVAGPMKILKAALTTDVESVPSKVTKTLETCTMSCLS